MLMKRTVTITVALLLTAAVSFSAGQAVQLFPWAGQQMNQVQSLTTLEVECLKASWKAREEIELLKDVKHTSRRTAFTATAMEFRAEKDAIVVDVQVDRKIDSNNYRDAFVRMAQNSRTEAIKMLQSPGAARWPMTIRLMSGDKVVLVRKFNQP